jgi:electron transfer flavoprotein beta subunit
MKILVAAKLVVDPNVKVRVNEDGSGIDTKNLKMAINPFDEIAVEEAVRLREGGKASEVIACSIGVKQSQEALRAALAIGADRAILVETDVELQPLGVAKVLKAVVEREKPDLVILGKQAIDDDCGQAGQMLAALLRWPQATCISKIEVNGRQANVTREIDRGSERLGFSLPAVLTVDLRLNVPRYITLPSLMKAKRKPIEVTTPKALEVDMAPRLVTLKTSKPPKRSAGRKVADARELIERLKNEAKVI